ncbi:MAG: hypothetical protein AB1Z16_03340 [Desulfotignum sp.]
MFSSISVAIPRGKTGYLVVLFSLILMGSVLVFFSMGYMNISIADIAGTALGLPFSAGAAFGASIVFLLNLARSLITGQWTDDSPSGCPRVFSDWRGAPVSRETLVRRLRARVQELNPAHRKTAPPVAGGPESCGKISPLCFPGGIICIRLTSAGRRYCLSGPVQRPDTWISFSHPGDIQKNTQSHQIQREYRP